MKRRDSTHRLPATPASYELHSPVLLDQQTFTRDHMVATNRLLSVCFSGIDLEQDTFTRMSSLLLENSVVVAHASIAYRNISLGGDPTEFALLGRVCVDPAHRGRGLGHVVVQALHDAIALPFILNCGNTLVSYYKTIGYEAVASQAIYNREGSLVVDDDPVMIFNNGHDVQRSNCPNAIYLGTDY